MTLSHPFSPPQATPGSLLANRSISRSLTNVSSIKSAFSPSASHSTFGDSYATIADQSKSQDWADRLQATMSLKELLRRFVCLGEI